MTRATRCGDWACYCREIAIQAISYACLLDFPTGDHKALSWAQWTRELAKAAERGDVEETRRLVEYVCTQERTG